MVLRLPFLAFLILLPLVANAQDWYQRKVKVPDTCKVTTPSEHTFVASPPYPAKAPPGAFLVGSEKLWTMLPNDAIWPPSQKTFWWRQEWSKYAAQMNMPKSVAPKLTVTARRLDAPAAPAKIWRPVPGYRGFSMLNVFLVGGIDFPTDGCWEVSANYEKDNVTFVVWIMQ